MKERLENYVYRIFDRLYEDEARRIIARDGIIGEAFDEITDDTYKKEVSREEIIHIIELVQESLEKKLASYSKNSQKNKILAEALSTNYFSWYGIHVWQSKVPYNFA